jgi:hypothetical protein
MDPHVGPVSLKISGTSAVLITRLGEALGTDDGGQVLMQALGLLDLAVKARRDGKRLAFYDPETLEFSEVAF